MLIRDTHGLFARVPSRTLFFSPRAGPDSSHNTSKVTKAEGKQIRGRALTGLLNTRAPRRWSPSLLKVATTRPAARARGRRRRRRRRRSAVFRSSEACSVSRVRAYVRTYAETFVLTAVPPRPRGPTQRRGSSRTRERRRKRSASRRWEGRNGRRRSQTTRRQTFLSFVRPSRPAGKRL